MSLPIPRAFRGVVLLGVAIVSGVLSFASPAAASSDAPPADDGAPARRYAHGSVSLLGSATLTAGFFGGSGAGTGFDATVLSGSLALRTVTRFGLAVEPRVGLDAFMVASPSGLYAAFAGRTGVAAGWAFALGRTVAFTPMVSYEVALVGGGVASNLSGVAHVVSAELPLTVFFGRRAFVEVFVRGGALWAMDQAAPVVAAGYRFGVVL
jgi:hypothetical protein